MRRGRGQWPVALAALTLSATLGSGVAAAPAQAAADPVTRAPQLAQPFVPPGAAAQGAVPATQPVHLLVTLAPSNAAGLQALLAQLYDPSSPEYHHWLAPKAFGQQFGPSNAAVAAVQAWLGGKGLHGAPSGFSIAVTAPASAVAAGLGTPLERYRAPDGHVGYSTTAAPLVPQSVATDVTGILGLNSFAQLQPQLAHKPAVAKPGVAGPTANADGLTACTAAQNQAGSSYYLLNQLGAAYGIGSLLADGQNGHTQTIGLYELGQANGTDVSTYARCFGLTNSVYAHLVDGGPTSTPAGTIEADLDIEQAMTQAPGARIIAYEGPNTATGAYDTWKAIVTADAAQVVSTSWGQCEPAAKTSGALGAYTTLFEQAATQGQTILAAAVGTCDGRGALACVPHHFVAIELARRAAHGGHPGV